MKYVNEKVKTQTEEFNPSIIVNLQWQGGGDTITYYGAKELEDFYLSEMSYVTIPTSLTANLISVDKIVGYPDISKQMKQAVNLLRERKPKKILSVGGGCDADIPIIAYLNQLYGSQLLVFWLDAHGDLNAPEESQTGLFYGMPARILMGASDLFSDVIEKPLQTQQFLHISGRDFDRSEIQYLQMYHISNFHHISIQELENLWIEKGKPFLYVHLDLDVLNPNEFPNTPLPVKGGLSKEEVLELLY